MCFSGGCGSGVGSVFRPAPANCREEARKVLKHSLQQGALKVLQPLASLQPISGFEA